MTMSVQERLKKAEADVAEAQARRQRLVAQLKERERKDQKRRAFLLGEVALEMLRTDDRFRNSALSLMDQRLKRRKDRELFGLSPKPGDETDAPEPERNSELDGCQPSGDNA